jgi:DNA-binding response OmpR family regulator
VTVEGDRPIVLLAEDERHLADLFASWLSETYEVRVAYDGTEAVELYDDAVDVVLLDRKMPGNSGDEVLEEIRESGGDCGVAMVTAVDPDLDVSELPFDEYLLKPTDEDELRSLVETLRRRTRCEAELRRHYRLTAKLDLLEEHVPPEELAASEEYRRLQDDLDALDRALSETVDDLSSADVGAVLRSESLDP